MNDLELKEGIASIIFKNLNMTAFVFSSYEEYIKEGGTAEYNETAEMILNFVKENSK